ncbi:unnamed protein product, partial [Amoebophrya sp. A25]
ASSRSNVVDPPESATSSPRVTEIHDNREAGSGSTTSPRGASTPEGATKSKDKNKEAVTTRPRVNLNGEKATTSDTNNNNNNIKEAGGKMYLEAKEIDLLDLELDELEGDWSATKSNSNTGAAEMFAKLVALDNDDDEALFDGRRFRAGGRFAAALSWIVETLVTYTERFTKHLEQWSTFLVGTSPRTAASEEDAAVEGSGQNGTTSKKGDSLFLDDVFADALAFTAEQVAASKSQKPAALKAESSTSWALPSWTDFFAPLSGALSTFEVDADSTTHDLFETGNFTSHDTLETVAGTAKASPIKSLAEAGSTFVPTTARNGTTAASFTQIAFGTRRGEEDPWPGHPDEADLNFPEAACLLRLSAEIHPEETDGRTTFKAAEGISSKDDEGGKWGISW